MLEYKVIYVATAQRYISYDDSAIETKRINHREQEALLNQLAQEGWRLVQTVSPEDEEFYLYMEREV